MKTRIKERPVWSTEKTEEINRSVLQLNQQKQFAWQCGWKRIPWTKVQAAVVIRCSIFALSYTQRVRKIQYREATINTFNTATYLRTPSLSI